MINKLNYNGETEKHRNRETEKQKNKNKRKSKKLKVKKLFILLCVIKNYHDKFDKNGILMNCILYKYYILDNILDIGHINMF